MLYVNLVLLYLNIHFTCGHFFQTPTENEDTDMFICTCASCDTFTTVGVMYKEFCYYININDRFLYNNDRVDQFSIAHVNNQAVIADSIVSRLTNEFYSSYKYPYINLKFYDSTMFSSYTSEYDKCIKLDISNNELLDDESRGCPPDPSILRTSKFEILFNQRREHTHKVPYKSCNVRTSGVLIDEAKTCLFSDTEQCSIAFIKDITSYRIFEMFMMQKYEEHIKVMCLESKLNQSLDNCLLNLFRYSSHIIYMNASFVNQHEASKFNFRLIGEKTGYFIVDLNRKTIYSIPSYQAGIHILLNRYKVKNLTHLCTEPEMKLTSNLVNLNSSVGSIDNTSERTLNDSKDSKGSADFTVFIVTICFLVLFVLATLVFKFKRSLDSESIEVFHSDGIQV